MIGFKTPFIVVTTRENVTIPKLPVSTSNANNNAATINGVQQIKNATTTAAISFVVRVSLINILFFSNFLVVVGDGGGVTACFGIWLLGTSKKFGLEFFLFELLSFSLLAVEF